MANQRMAPCTSMNSFAETKSALFHDHLLVWVKAS